MIMHCVDKLVEAGIKEIMAITGPEHMGAIVSLLGSGKDFGAHFTYRVQDEAGGIAQALGLWRHLSARIHCCVISATTFHGVLDALCRALQKDRQGAMLSSSRSTIRGGTASLNCPLTRRQSSGMRKAQASPSRITRWRACIL